MLRNGSILFNLDSCDERLMPYCRGSVPNRRWPPNMLSNFTYGCFQGFQIPKYSNAYSLQQRLIRISSSGALQAGNSWDARICLSVFGNLGISTFSNLELRKCANLESEDSGLEEFGIPKI